MPTTRPRVADRKLRFFSVPEIAEALSVSTKTVRRRIAEGALPCHRIGGVLRISEDDLASYVATRRL